MEETNKHDGTDLSSGNFPSDTSDRSLMFLLGEMNAKIDYLVKSIREQAEENRRLEGKIDQTHEDLSNRIAPIEERLNESRGRRNLIRAAWGGAATILGAMGAAIVKTLGG